MADSPKRFDPEFDLLEKMVANADGHAMSISLIQRMKATHQWKRIIERAEQARELTEEARRLEEQMARRRRPASTGGGSDVMGALEGLRREVRALREEVQEIKALLTQGSERGRRRR